jgi:hypothetical protein
VPHISIVFAFERFAGVLFVRGDGFMVGHSAHSAQCRLVVCCIPQDVPFLAWKPSILLSKQEMEGLNVGFESTNVCDDVWISWLVFGDIPIE